MNESARVAERPAKAKGPERMSHRFYAMDGRAYGTSFCGKTNAEEMRAKGARELGPNVDPDCPECWEKFMRGSVS